MDIKKYPYKIYLEADIITKPETLRLRKEASSVLGIPKEEERQVDLTYFTSIFVSSGTNLNDAHFLPSEMILANETVSNKAVDIEHKETDIIGHIYKHAYVDANYKELQVEDLFNKEVATIDKEEMHIEIASVIYSSRFPAIAKEIEEKKWKVSMEAYYQSFDIKVGDLIVSQAEAEAADFEISSDVSFDSTVKVIKNGKIVAEGKPARVLRGILFSGVGIVKQPANPPSIILETSSKKDKVIVIDLDKASEERKEDNNKVTSLNIGTSFESTSILEKAGNVNTDVGLCVSYKKEVLDDTFKDQDTDVTHRNWCTLFEQECTAFGHIATDDNCLRNQVKLVAGVYASLYDTNNNGSGDSHISELINKINKICDR